MSYLEEKFPDLYSRIQAERARNPELDEICRDLETLAKIINTKGSELELRAREDIRESIKGLEDEISALFVLSDTQIQSIGSQHNQS